MVTVGKREVYSSANGDRWFLCRDPANGNVFVRHEANPASGGHLTDLGIGAFLSQGELHPEHQALLHLIGTLTEGSPPAPWGRRQHRRKPRSGRRHLSISARPQPLDCWRRLGHGQTLRAAADHFRLGQPIRTPLRRKGFNHILSNSPS